MRRGLFVGRRSLAVVIVPNRSRANRSFQRSATGPAGYANARVDGPNPTKGRFACVASWKSRSGFESSVHPCMQSTTPSAKFSP
jgi:hypothetical protein